MISRTDELKGKQVEQMKSHVESLRYQREALQKDLDALDALINAEQADIDLLCAEYKPALEKLAEKVKKEILVEKV